MSKALSVQYGTHAKHTCLYVCACHRTYEHACAGSVVSAGCLAPLWYRLAFCVVELYLDQHVFNATACRLKLHANDSLINMHQLAL